MDILGWITKHPIVTILLLLCITVLNIESNLRVKTLNKIGIAKFSALIAFLRQLLFICIIHFCIMNLQGQSLVIMSLI